MAKSKRKTNKGKKIWKLEGREIHNATTPLVITITKDDIRKGNNKAPDACAAAQACLRQLPQIEQARVHLSRIYLKMKPKHGQKEGPWVRFATPRALRNEIVAFDRGGKFQADEFTLLPVEESRLRDNHALPYKERAIKRGDKKRKYHIVENVRAKALSV